MIRMDVTVIIPLYNGSPWIKQTLSSIHAQIHSPREILVVDDGSTDTSPGTVRDFEDATLLQSPGDGAGTARHVGLKRASTELVAFLDQDDVWHPEHLSRLSSVLQKHPQAPVAVAQETAFRAPSAPSYHVDEAPSERFDPWDRFPLNSIATPSCALIRRAALRRIDGWPHAYSTSDFPAWFKLSVHGAFRRARQVTVGKRHHDANTLESFRRDPIPYLQDRIDACGDALEHRRDHRADVPHKFQDRLNLLEAIGGVFTGALRADHHRLIESACRIERSEVDAEMREAIANFAMFMFEPRIDGSRSEQSAFLERLVRYWPDDCPEARTLFYGAVARTVLSGWSFLDCLTRRPTRRAAWTLAARAASVRLRRRAR